MEPDIEAVGDQGRAGLVAGPDIRGRVGGEQIDDVVVLGGFDAEPIHPGCRLGRQIERGGAAAIGNEVGVGEAENDVLLRDRNPGLLDLGHGEDGRVAPRACGAAQDVFVAAAERGTEEAGPVDPAVEPLHRRVAVGPDLGHVVPALEVRDRFTEVQLVTRPVVVGVGDAAEAIGGEVVLRPSFLAVQQHRDPVERAELRVGLEQLVGVVGREDLVVAGEVVEDHHALVGLPTVVECLVGPGGRAVAAAAAALAGGGVAEVGVAPVEDDVLVEDVEVAGRAVADTVALAAGGLAVAVERFRHEQEVPLHAARLVDAVLPELGRQALREITAQAVDALVRLRSRGAGGVAGLGEPVARVVGEVLPQLPGVGRKRFQGIALQQVFLLVRG